MQKVFLKDPIKSESCDVFNDEAIICFVREQILVSIKEKVFVNESCETHLQTHNAADVDSCGQTALNGHRMCAQKLFGNVLVGIELSVCAHFADAPMCLFMHDFVAVSNDSSCVHARGTPL